MEFTYEFTVHCGEFPIYNLSLDALDIIYVAIKLVNTIVKICEFILTFSEYHKNIQRTSKEGSRKLFFTLFCLIIIYYSLFLLIFISHGTYYKRGTWAILVRKGCCRDPEPQDPVRTSIQMSLVS